LSLKRGASKIAVGVGSVEREGLSTTKRIRRNPARLGDNVRGKLKLKIRRINNTREENYKTRADSYGRKTPQMGARKGGVAISKQRTLQKICGRAGEELDQRK